MRSIFATTAAGLLGVALASTAHAQTAAQIQSQKTAEAAHETRERADNASFEAHRERLRKQLAAAQASGNKAKIAQIQQQLAAADTHLQKEKSEATADKAHDARLNAEKPRH
jgi:DNA polymerase III delta prime subunit